MYFNSRRQRLLDLIGLAMGKDVTDPAEPSVPEDYDLEEEDPTDEELDDASFPAADISTPRIPNRLTQPMSSLKPPP